MNDPHIMFDGPFKTNILPRITRPFFNGLVKHYPRIKGLRDEDIDPFVHERICWIMQEVRRKSKSAVTGTGTSGSVTSSVKPEGSRPTSWWVVDKEGSEEDAQLVYGSTPDATQKCKPGEVMPQIIDRGKPYSAAIDILFDDVEGEDKKANYQKLTDLLVSESFFNPTTQELVAIRKGNTGKINSDRALHTLFTIAGNSGVQSPEIWVREIDPPAKSDSDDPMDDVVTLEDLGIPPGDDDDDGSGGGGGESEVSSLQWTPINKLRFNANQLMQGDGSLPPTGRKRPRPNISDSNSDDIGSKKKMPNLDSRDPRSSVWKSHIPAAAPWARRLGRLDKPDPSDSIE